MTWQCPLCKTKHNAAPEPDDAVVERMARAMKKINPVVEEDGMRWMSGNGVAITAMARAALAALEKEDD